MFVDPQVQGALVKRVIIYWMLCLCVITTMLLCWDILAGPARPPWKHLDSMWFHYGPALIASLLVLPLIVLDIVRISNRFAGPLVRLRRSMRELARGRHVEPIRFRDGDFWQEFAEEFNAIAARMQRECPSEQTDTQQEEETETVAAGSD